MGLVSLICVICVFFGLCQQSNFSATVCEDERDRKYQSLVTSPDEDLRPGIYESDDISLILTHTLQILNADDVAVFDIDDVLITPRLDPFYMVHTKNKTALFERFDSLEKIKELYFFFLHTSHSPSVVSLMDRGIPELIALLQKKGIKCIGNTSLRPLRYGLTHIFDDASARIELLKELGISFSQAEFEPWDFETLRGTCVPEQHPLFKEGIIFSGRAIPKHVVQVELFKKLKFIPRKLVFIDDLRRNISGMQDCMTSLGVECYSFRYCKKESRDMLSYFPTTTYVSELRLLESFVEKLLAQESVDEHLTGIHYAKFLRKLL